LDGCFRVSEAAANLAIETDPTKWDDARHTFWLLYWGTLSIVEDPDVEKAMVEFGKRIPTSPVEELTLPVSQLRKPSYDLAHAFRDLVLRSWKIKDLGRLRDLRCEDISSSSPKGNSSPAKALPEK